MLLNYLKRAECRPNCVTLDVSLSLVFQTAELSREDESLRAECAAKMNKCEIDFDNNCAIVLLREPIRSQTRQCLSLSCKDVRSCIQHLLDDAGCP